MSYTCSKCDRTFTTKQSLEYHIEHEACKTANFNCKYCNTGFTTKNSMYRHMKHSCKAKKEQENQKTEILERLAKLEENNKRVVDENKNLKKKMVKMEKAIKTASKTASTNNSKSGQSTNQNININNGTINNDNRVMNNITIVAYGKEDITEIDRDEIIQALKTGFNSTKRLTEVVHFNPKYPKFSNIKRSNFNMKNKLMYHDGENWITTTDPHMIDDLYNKKRDFIEENIENYQDALNKYDMTRLQRWLSVDDDDHRISKIKGDLREMLFNKKEIAEMNEKSIEVQVMNVDTIEDMDDEISEHTIICSKKKRGPGRTGKHRKIATARKNR